PGWPYCACAVAPKSSSVVVTNDTFKSCRSRRIFTLLLRRVQTGGHIAIAQIDPLVSPREPSNQNTFAKSALPANSWQSSDPRSALFGHGIPLSWQVPHLAVEALSK